MIIGISGKIGTGKTTFGLILANKLGFELVSIATPLKELVSCLYYIPKEWLYSNKEKKIYVPDFGGKSVSLRFLLQYWGEAFRQIDEDFWIKKTINRYFNSDIIIDDVRYINEAEYIKSEGGILIKIEPYDGYKFSEDSNHISETALDNFNMFDYVIKPEYGKLQEAARYLVSDIVKRFFNDNK